MSIDQYKTYVTCMLWMKIFYKVNEKLLENKIMNNANIHVKICDNNECIYENNNSLDLSGNNLTGVISSLKDIQIKINDFISSLVNKQDDSVNVENRLTSESDSDFESEIEVNPKKCKLID
ncbi:uncharacterized protein LOC128893842 [Hylaeus anthracinus]|uniref:uncharacterized protein LOC128893842 n=1 Tax=Hylaeus anthracinus TaxID=313031 RepID=UPI0023B887C9|nr:uncharacterized protein LOC128893842 [Hylaeus anthracinus]